MLLYLLLFVLILNLHYYYAYFLVGLVGLYFGNVPVARVEDEELVRSRIHKLGLVHLVIVVDDVGTIRCLGSACNVVEQSEALAALHDILEVDILTMTLGATFFKVAVLAILRGWGVGLRAEP